jgi:hypothetical protein
VVSAMCAGYNRRLPDKVEAPANQGKP